MKDGEALDQFIAGRLGVTRDGSIYTTMALPKGDLDYGFQPSEVNVFTQNKSERMGEGPDPIIQVFSAFYQCFAHCSTSDKGTLRGRILDADTQRLLEGAKVEAFPVSGAGSFVTRSLSDGQYVLSMPEGSYRVVVSLSGYASNEVVTATETGVDTTLDIKLTPVTSRFHDETFDLNDWDFKIAGDPLPKGSSAIPAQAGSTFDSNVYRTLHTQLTDPSRTVETVHIFKLASYHPAIEGAIKALHFRMDIRSITAVGAFPAECYFQIRQDGLDHFYTLKLGKAVTDSWATYDAPGLTESDFFGAVNLGPNGGLIDFGFRVRGGREPNQLIAFDNWSVHVEPV